MLKQFIGIAVYCLCLTAQASDDSVAFFRAVQIDNVSGVSELLKAGFDPNTAEPNRGETGLILAVREDANRVFDALLADPRTDIERQAANTNTALMMAAYKRNMHAVQALLARDAAVNRAGWSPLHYAAAGGADEIASLLVQRHAALEAEGPAKLTPLMMAAREGHESTVLLLLNLGADPGKRNSEGLTAAEQAVQRNHDYIRDAIASWQAEHKK